MTVTEIILTFTKCPKIEMFGLGTVIFMKKMGQLSYKIQPTLKKWGPKLSVLRLKFLSYVFTFDYCDRRYIRCPADGSSYSGRASRSLLWWVSNMWWKTTNQNTENRPIKICKKLTNHNRPARVQKGAEAISKRDTNSSREEDANRRNWS